MYQYLPGQEKQDTIAAFLFFLLSCRIWCLLMQTHSSSNPINAKLDKHQAATIQPRSWGDSAEHEPQSAQPQTLGHDFSHVDLFAHDPGTRSVANIIQAKLTIGEPNDQYEQEADQVADQVMGMAAPPSPTIQRQTNDASANDELTAHELTHGVQQTQRVQRAPQPQVINAPTQVISSVPGELSPEEQAFFNLTTEALTQVSLAESQFSAWLSGITIPYAIAWTSHKNALKAADQLSKENNALIIGAILAAIPGGVGGTVGNAMKDLGAGVALVDGVKDLAKYGLREAGRAATSSPGGKGNADPAGASPTIGGIPSSSIQGGSGFDAMPEDPLVWQNNTNRRSQNEVLIPAKQSILDWQHKVNNHDPNFLLNFNPIEAVRSTLKLKINGAFSLFALPPIDSNLKILYEQGFLIDWINTKAATSITNVPSSRDKVRDKLAEYGQRIGINDVRARLSQVGVFSSSEGSSFGGMMIR